MFRFVVCLTALALFSAAGMAQAAADTPVGTWRTIDDATGKAKSIVEISEVDGALQGKVVKVLQSDQGPHPICKECEGERHNQPVEGMTILWGLTPDGNEWTGGQILDPSNGKTYKCKLALLDSGTKLKVRGFIGFSLFGRSQVWQRVESEPDTDSSTAAAASIAAPASTQSAPTPAPDSEDDPS